MSVNRSDLQAIFDRIEAGKPLSPQELQTLAAAVRSQQITLATGDRAAAIGGSADGAVIITGDGNLVLQASDAEFFKENLRFVLRESRNTKRARVEQLLLNEVKQEVNARLQQSLFNAVLIELRKQQQFHQVKRRWDAEVKIGTQPGTPLPNDVNILEVFDNSDIAGKLLILGAPGSGKTTTQLELARALIERAEQQADYPIPVLFSLPSWKKDDQSIREWLLVELKSRYGIRYNIGKKWLENRKLLPFLDGLDELEVSRQETCVKAINELIQGDCRPQYLIVCSRTEEYGKYNTRLQLNGAICLQPLSISQIRDYLVAVKHFKLWQLIVDDSSLLELSRIPLLLNFMILVYKNIPSEMWKQFNSPQELLNYLLDSYVHHMLNRSISVDLYIKQKPPTSKQTLHWLVWLSQQLQKESKIEFLIEEMQPFALLTKSQRKIHSVLSWLIAALVISLLVSVSHGSVFGNLGVLVGATILGLSGKLTYEIQPIEILTWSLEGAKTGLTIGTMVGIGLGSLVGWLLGGSLISATFYGLVGVLFFGLIGALIVGLIYTLIGELTESNLEIERFPNQGIWKSLVNAGIAGLISGAISALIGFLIFTLAGSPLSGMWFGAMLGLKSGLMFGGGIACIQHFALRLILYSSNRIPWNYAQFLTYTRTRLFLQQIGGRYRFIHRLLQEHLRQ